MGDLICGFIVGVPIGWIFNVIMSVSLIGYVPPENRPQEPLQVISKEKFLSPQWILGAFTS